MRIYNPDPNPNPNPDSNWMKVSEEESAELITRIANIEMQAATEREMTQATLLTLILTLPIPLTLITDLTLRF